VFKAATGLAGGGGLMGIGVCGDYAGGAMVLSQLVGRERSNFDDPEGIRYKSFELTRKFLEEYTRELGSITCRNIQLIEFGRPYYIADANDYEKFEAAGAHVDKCPDGVGKAAQLAVALILDEGLVEPKKDELPSRP
jgi:hypothetical protein